MIDSQKKICSVSECSGCGLCVNVCPVKAISMHVDRKFGHKRPVVNSAVCVQCGICERKCPVNDPVQKKKSEKVYAAWQTDDSKHYTSSSGGIAAALYEKYLDMGAWIVGVKIGEQLEPKFEISNRNAQITEFKSSKYVQPVTGTIYKEVLEKISQGEKVIFIGLPCHCAAMRRCAEGVKNDNLLLVDLVCHGVPAFQSLADHIREVEKRYEKKTSEIYFRNKEFGVGLYLKNDKKIFYERGLHEDVFMHSFISGDLFAENCYQCTYACEERVGDLTICDFWGIGKIVPFNHKISRVSAVLINTSKGQEAFELIQDMVYCEERPLQEVIEGNDQLREPSKKGRHREELIKYSQASQLEKGFQVFYGTEVKQRYKKRYLKDKIKWIVKKLMYYR